MCPLLVYGTSYIEQCQCEGLSGFFCFFVVDSFPDSPANQETEGSGDWTQAATGAGSSSFLSRRAEACQYEVFFTASGRVRNGRV